MQNKTGHRQQSCIILTGKPTSALGLQIPLEDTNCCHTKLAFDTPKAFLIFGLWTNFAYVLKKTLAGPFSKCSHSQLPFVVT